MFKEKRVGAHLKNAHDALEDAELIGWGRSGAFILLHHAARCVVHAALESEGMSPDGKIDVLTEHVNALPHECMIRDRLSALTRIDGNSKTDLSGFPEKHKPNTESVKELSVLVKSLVAGMVKLYGVDLTDDAPVARRVFPLRSSRPKARLAS